MSENQVSFFGFDGTHRPNPGRSRCHGDGNGAAIAVTVDTDPCPDTGLGRQPVEGTQSVVHSGPGIDPAPRPLALAVSGVVEPKGGDTATGQVLGHVGEDKMFHTRQALAQNDGSSRRPRSILGPA